MNFETNLSSSINPTHVINEFFSGLTIALLLIPESIAFASILGLPPMTGIHNTMIISFITSIIGGCPTLISGSTAAVATSIVGVKTLLGAEFIIPTVILGGIFQILATVTGLYKYLSKIPKNIMSGFLVALAGLIAVNQLENFKTKDHEFFTGIKMANTILFTLVSLGIAVYGVLSFNIQLTKKDTNVIHIPGGLMAMFAITAFIFAFYKYYDLVRVKDLGVMTPSLPSFQIPKAEWTSPSNFMKMAPFSLSMAFAGLMESLIALKGVEDHLHIKANPFKESLSQGIANIVSGFGGGFGGCVLVGQTRLNTDNGSTTQFSSIITSVLFIILTMFLAPAVNEIPIAAIVGIMLLVVYKTGDWTALFTPQAFDKHWFVTLITIAVGFLSGNLSLGIVVGMVINKLMGY